MRGVIDKKRLWSLLKRVPKGKVTTYKALADALDTSPRAVGSMLHSNKHPERNPCYKVVMSNGCLGGFALGVEEKARRLKADGIPIKENKIPNFEIYRY